MSISDTIRKYVSYDMNLNWHSDLRYNGIDFFPVSYILDMAMIEVFLIDSSNSIKQLVLDSKQDIDPSKINSTYSYRVTSLEDAKTYSEECRIFRVASYAAGYVTTTNITKPLQYDTSRPLTSLDLQTGVPYTVASLSMVDNPRYWTKYNSDSLLFQFFPLKTLQPNPPDGSNPDSMAQWPIYRSSGGWMKSGIDEYVETACKQTYVNCTICQRALGVMADSSCRGKCGNPAPYCWMYPNVTYGMFHLQKQTKVDGIDTWSIGSIDVDIDTDKINIKYIDDDNSYATLNSVSSKYKIIVNLVTPNMGAINDMNMFRTLTSTNKVVSCCSSDLDKNSDMGKTCSRLGFECTNEKKYNNKCQSAMSEYCTEFFYTRECIDYCNNGIDVDGNPINCDTIMNRKCSTIPKDSPIHESCRCFLPDWAMDKYWSQLESVPGSSLMKKTECEYIPCTTGDNSKVVKRNNQRTGKLNCNNVNLCLNSQNIKLSGTIEAESIDITQYSECVDKQNTKPPDQPLPSKPPSGDSKPVRTNIENILLSIKPSSWNISDDDFIKVVAIFMIVLLILCCLFFMIIIVI